MSPRTSAERTSAERERHTPVFYGRGGAGNANKHTEQGPPPPPDLGTPTLKSKTYTTGRGGTGNMAVNHPDHPEIARERQDVDVPHEPLVAERNYPIGRGGAGNIHHLTEEEQAEAKEYNKHVRANSKGRESSKDRGKLQGLADKGKEMLFGHKENKS